MTALFFFAGMLWIIWISAFVRIGKLGLGHMISYVTWAWEQKGCLRLCHYRAIKRISNEFSRPRSGITKWYPGHEFLLQMSKTSRKIATDILAETKKLQIKIIYQSLDGLGGPKTNPPSIVCTFWGKSGNIRQRQDGRLKLLSSHKGGILIQLRTVIN